MEIEMPEITAQNMGFDLNETAFLNEDFNNQLVYFPTQNDKLNLSWQFHLNLKEDKFVSAQVMFEFFHSIDQS